MTCDWLRAGRSGNRIPVAARFSTPVQTDPGAHLASCTMGTGSFPGAKSDRSVTLTPHPLLVPWSWKSIQLYLYSPYGPYGLYRASVPVQGCSVPYFKQWFNALYREHLVLKYWKLYAWWTWGRAWNWKCSAAMNYAWDAFLQLALHIWRPIIPQKFCKSFDQTVTYSEQTEII